MTVTPNGYLQGRYKQINFVNEYNCLRIKLVGGRPVGYLQKAWLVS